MKIRIENLSYSYNLQNKSKLNVLENINLDIEECNFVVIIGESGCGKTTFLNLLAGLLHPTSGSLLVDDKETAGTHPSRSLITQQPSLLPWLSVRDNITFGCELRSEKENLSERAEKFIKLMGLQSVEEAYPNKLSLGMAQRVAFARGLIGMPEVLLLDEPFASLDFSNRSRLQAELLKIWEGQRYTVILVTHDIDEAILVGRKIVILGNKPAQIEHIIEIDSEYPRDLNDKKLFNLKVEIQKKLSRLVDFY